MNNSSLSETERRKRLLAVYELLVQLAAKKRALDAALQQEDQKPHEASQKA